MNEWMNGLVSKSPKLQTNEKQHDHYKVPFLFLVTFYAEVISGLQKSCKNSTQNTCIPIT